jgi:broad-specificity NMP kinase
VPSVRVYRQGRRPHHPHKRRRRPLGQSEPPATLQGPSRTEDGIRSSGTRLPRLVIICGQAGVGKSAVRDQVASVLRCRSFGPDDFLGDWNPIYEGVDRAVRSVVECVALPRALRARIARFGGAFVVHLTAETETRRRRLLERGDNPAKVEEWLGNAVPIGYGDPVRVDLEIATDAHTAAEIAALILRRVGYGGSE